MKINYHKNPLYTTIDIDEHEKQILWYKIKTNEMEDMLFSAHFHIQDDKYFNLDDARRTLNPEYYCTDDKSGLDKRCDMLLGYFLEELQSKHAGDCTCIACSCDKCRVESLLGIDTIKGLGKHAAYKIDSAFGQDNERSLDEALEHLENYNPIKGVGWEKSSQEEFDKHIPRWKSEAKVAYEWLLNYKKEHFSN